MLAASRPRCARGAPRGGDIDDTRSRHPRSRRAAARARSSLEHGARLERAALLRGVPDEHLSVAADDEPVRDRPLAANALLEPEAPGLAVDEVHRAAEAVPEPPASDRRG